MSPPPGPLLRGPSEVFRIVKVIRISRPHDPLPGIDSCCTVTPFQGLQWAATPKLTMIAGAGNFPSGRFRCEAPFLGSTLPCGVPLSRRISSEFMKTKEINILFCCERFSAEVRTGGKPGHLVLSKTVPLLGSKAADRKQVGTESSAYLHAA